MSCQLWWISVLTVCWSRNLSLCKESSAGQSRNHWHHEAAILRRLAGKFAPKLLLKSAIATARNEDTFLTLLVEHAGLGPTIDQLCDPQICCKVVEALAAAHAVGVVHSDLKPEHICMQNDVITIIDWDLGAFLTTHYGALLHPAVLKQHMSDKHLSALPNHLCWGVFVGNNGFASWWQHFGYGPSGVGDLESLAYLFLQAMSVTALPWMDRDLSSVAVGNIKWRLVHELQTLPMAPDGIDQSVWMRFWHLLNKHAGALRTASEADAAAELALFIQQDLLGCEQPWSWPVPDPAYLMPPPATKGRDEGMEDETSQEATADRLFDSSFVSRARVKAEFFGRMALEEYLDVELGDKVVQVSNPLFNALRSMQLVPPDPVAHVQPVPVPQEQPAPAAQVQPISVAEEQPAPVAQEQPTPAAQDQWRATVQIDCVGTISGSQLMDALDDKDKHRGVFVQQMTVDEQPFSKGLTSDGTLTLVAELVLGQNARVIAGKMSQLEVALFSQGMQHPDQVHPRLVGAVVFCRRSDNTSELSHAVDWVRLPRCRALAIQGLLYAIRVNNPELERLFLKAGVISSIIASSRWEDKMAKMLAASDAKMLKMAAEAEAKMLQMAAAVAEAVAAAGVKAEARMDAKLEAYAASLRQELVPRQKATSSRRQPHLKGLSKRQARARRAAQAGLEVRLPPQAAREGEQEQA